MIHAINLMKHILLFLSLGFAFCLDVSLAQTPEPTPTSNTADPIAWSQALIEKHRQGESTLEIQEKIKSISVDDLAQALPNDDAKRTFWMNVYNGFVQVLLTDNPALFDDRVQFFTQPRVWVAGRKLSLDDIEHGIIRGSRVKWTLGYTQSIFVSSYERKLRVNSRDGRIHFSLNCGAKSCPPVAVFRLGDVNEQMDVLSKNYLENYTQVDLKNRKVTASPLMSWFRADFGGKKGVLKFLKSFEILGFQCCWNH